MSENGMLEVQLQENYYTVDFRNAEFAQAFFKEEGNLSYWYVVAEFAYELFQTFDEPKDLAYVWGYILYNVFDENVDKVEQEKTVDMILSQASELEGVTITFSEEVQEVIGKYEILELTLSRILNNRDFKSEDLAAEYQQITESNETWKTRVNALHTLFKEKQYEISDLALIWSYILFNVLNKTKDEEQTKETVEAIVNYAEGLPGVLLIFPKKVQKVIEKMQKTKEEI